MIDMELLLERLERLAMVLDELMPQCAELVRDALALLKEQEETIKNLEQEVEEHYKEGEQSNEVGYDSTKTNAKKQYSFGNCTITCDSSGHCDDFNCIFGDVCPGNDDARSNETSKWSSSSEKDSSG